MENQSSMHRTIRQLIGLNRHISNEPDDSPNIAFLRLVFLWLLKEIEGDRRRPQAHRGYLKLRLFADTRGERQLDSGSIIENHLMLFNEFNLSQGDAESILDNRILILGGLFEALKSQSRRRSCGIYYTPYRLARAICKLTLDAFESQESESQVSRLLGARVLDNACGSGTFLFAMLEEMLTRITTRARTVVLDGSNVETTKLDALGSHLLSNSLFGHDLDADAIAIAEAQLWLALCRLQVTDSSFIPRSSLRVADTLVSEPNGEKYDIIIGNPPYMRLTSREAEYRQAIKTRYTTTREYNTHALFIQASLSRLEQGGILGYLIHKNLLTLDTFRSLRRSILESHRLLHLSDCGPKIFHGVTAETAVIVLQKGSHQVPSTISLSSYDSKSGSCRGISTIDWECYCNLISSWNHRYLMGISPEAIPYLMHMTNLPLLSSMVSIKRGIETGCNRQFISDRPKSKGNWKSLLRGRDISKYAVNGTAFLDHDVTKLAKSGREDLQEIPKVVLQQNAKHPIAFYDSGRYLVLNSTTYISDAREELLKTICVLLNSNLVSWFFRTVMTNNASLTVNLLPNNLGLLPIPTELDLQQFCAINDVLARLRTASDSSQKASTKFQLLHETLVESLVVAAYFPHLVGSSSAFHRIQKKTLPLASCSIDFDISDEAAINSAKNILARFPFLAN